MCKMCVALRIVVGFFVISVTDGSVIYRCFFFFFFQAEDGIRDLVRSRGLGDVYKRQARNLDRGYTPCRDANLVSALRLKFFYTKSPTSHRSRAFLLTSGKVPGLAGEWAARCPACRARRDACHFLRAKASGGQLPRLERHPGSRPLRDPGDRKIGCHPAARADV